jgi:hypothetical protein
VVNKIITKKKEEGIPARVAERERASYVVNKIITKKKEEGIPARVAMGQNRKPLRVLQLVLKKTRPIRPNCFG